jgi:hypothetical protein
VFRKLDELSYLTSYSHRGKYYALRSCCQFDKGGLWLHKGIRFSKYGSLRATVKHYVDHGPAGYSAAELDDALHVETRQPLLQLVNQTVIVRQRLGGALVHFSAAGEQRQRQLKARSKIAGLHPGGAAGEVREKDVKAAALMFLSLLDERQRRLFAGLQSLEAGRGGDRQISELFEMDPHTVASGRAELLRGRIDPERVRKAVGGRKPAGER